MERLQAVCGEVEGAAGIRGNKGALSELELTPRSNYEMKLFKINNRGRLPPARSTTGDLSKFGFAIIH